MAAALGCVAFLAMLAGPAAADTLFWSNYSASLVSHGEVPAGNGADLALNPAAESPYGTTVDAATGKVYWAGYGSASIDVANIDGSGSQTLNTTGTTIIEPAGLAIDPAAGKIYWANDGLGTISFANLDGSGGGTLNTTGAPTSGVYGAVVDPALGRIYWASYSSDQIGFANLDGTGGGSLNITGATPEGPTSVAIDARQHRIYWTNNAGASIGFADLSGGVGETFDTTGANIDAPTGIAIDDGAGKLYWANESGEALGSAALDGSGARDLPISGATIDGAAYPVLLAAPTVGTDPVVSGGLTPGSALTCGGATWAGDQVESFLFRAPRSVAYSWTLNGAPIGNAATPTLAATISGTYACQVTATNDGGATTAVSAPVTVAAPAAATPAGAKPPIPAALTTVKLSKIRLNAKQGTGIVLAHVSGPGRLYLSGKKVIAAQALARSAGLVKLKVQAKGKARRTLLRVGRVKVNFSLVFAAAGGGGAAAHTSIVLRHRQS